MLVTSIILYCKAYTFCFPGSFTFISFSGHLCRWDCPLCCPHYVEYRCSSSCGLFSCVSCILFWIYRHCQSHRKCPRIHGSSTRPLLPLISITATGMVFHVKLNRCSFLDFQLSAASQRPGCGRGTSSYLDMTSCHCIQLLLRGLSSPPFYIMYGMGRLHCICSYLPALVHSLFY